MKKLKLNKQTISLLGNDGQKNIVGGGNTYQNTCPVTNHAPCASYTCPQTYVEQCGSNYDCTVL